MPQKTKESSYSSTKSPKKEREDESHRGLDLDNCHVTIHIANVENINIYYCSSPPKSEPTKPKADGKIDYSDCIPFVDGHKPKEDYRTRLNGLIQKHQMPSVLGALFMNLARRFLQGYEAETEIEENAFAIFQKMSQRNREILECMLQGYEGDGRKNRFFSSEIEAFGTDAVPVKEAGALLFKELLKRTSVHYFDDPNCFENEHPGLLREKGAAGNDDVSVGTYVNISKINGLRTNDYLPRLTLGEFRDEEFQRVCKPEVQGDTIELNCKPQTSNCVGTSIDGLCLRVQEIMAGDVVLLQGFNYFSINGRVRLLAEPPGTTVRELETLVCGDTSIGLTEIVNGFEQIIADSRVKDQLLFTIPEDLPEGVYRLHVVMPKDDGSEVISPAPQYIRVMPPRTTRFQIATEELKAIRETSPSWLGSDEVGIKILSTAINNAGEIGEIQSNDFRFGDLDSGNTRQMDRVIFDQSNVAGVVIAIIGHEIDNDDLYEKEVEEFHKAFVEVLKSEWKVLVGTIGAAASTIALALGLSSGWAAAIGSVLMLSINSLIALVGRADLLIEDTIALSSLDLAALTSVNFPAPPTVSYNVSHGIEVTVEAVSKDVQYREHRIYDDDGKYRIRLRYNRV